MSSGKWRPFCPGGDELDSERLWDGKTILCPDPSDMGNMIMATSQNYKHDIEVNDINGHFISELQDSMLTEFIDNVLWYY